MLSSAIFILKSNEITLLKRMLWTQDIISQQLKIDREE
jgi:hypothetical protein